MAKVVNITFQFRRDTEANWLSHADVIPSAGEPCVTLDGEYAGQIKIGDGVTCWGDLDYAGNDIVDVDSKDELPVMGSKHKLYVVHAQNKIYRWSPGTGTYEPLFIGGESEFDPTTITLIHGGSANG